MTETFKEYIQSFDGLGDWFGFITGCVVFICFVVAMGWLIIFVLISEMPWYGKVAFMVGMMVFLNMIFNRH